MALRLRDYRSGISDAQATIPSWPGDHSGAAIRARQANAPGLAGSPSELHARQAWGQARQQTVVRTTELARQAGADHAQAMASLEMVGRVAGHISKCGRCQQTGRWDQATPAAWLLWALGTREALRRIMRPVLAEYGVPMPKQPPRRGG